MNTSLLVALLAIIVAPALTYFGVVRRLSGKVATSDAADLWEEARSMREDYRAQLNAADTRIGTLEDYVDGLREELRSCKTVLYDLQARIERAAT